MFVIQPNELKDYIEYIQEIKSETDFIEVKTAEKGCTKKLYDTLSSFSNKSGGGIIIFGLDENKDFEIVGVYDSDDLQKQVTNKCNEMVPKVRPNFTILKIEDKIVVSAEIPEILIEEKPCYYSGAGMNKGSYIRVGDSDEHMTSYEIYNLTSYKKRIDEDIRIVDKANIDDLDMEKIQQYLDIVKKNRPNFSKFKEEVALEKLGIVGKIGEEYKPTIAGLLCFGICPDLILPQLVVTASVIPGFNIGDIGNIGERFVDNKKITGTIPEMVRQSVEFIIKNMKKRTIIQKDTGQRSDMMEYPVDAIREAVINCLVHRDYSIHTESNYIAIRMFNDRLEITNPGGLYGDLTIENLDEIVNPPVRNKTIVRILEELEEIENRSSGIATMINGMRELKLQPPIFKDERGNFSVTFKNHNLMTKDDREWLIKIDEKLTENEAYALVFMKNNEKMTNGDYQKLNNVNRDKALSELKALIYKGLIKTIGVGSGTSYILNEQKVEIKNYIQEVFKLETEDEIVEGDNKLSEINNEIAGNDNKSPEIDNKSPEIDNEIAGNNNESPEIKEEMLFNDEKPIDLKISNEDLILDYTLKNGKIKNQDVRKITGLRDSASRELLMKMVDRGKLEAKGKNRGRYYVVK